MNLLGQSHTNSIRLGDEGWIGKEIQKYPVLESTKKAGLAAVSADAVGTGTSDAAAGEVGIGSLADEIIGQGNLEEGTVIKAGHRLVNGRPGHLMNPHRVSIAVIGPAGFIGGQALQIPEHTQEVGVAFIGDDLGRDVRAAGAT